MTARLRGRRQGPQPEQVKEVREWLPLSKVLAYVCLECGAESPKWLGRCPQCGHWNTLEPIRARGDAGSAMGRARGRGGSMAIQGLAVRQAPRLVTGISEFDRVLGGGLVPGSVILVAGDPGTGKSTLLLQAAAVLSLSQRVLYVSGEESAAQVRLRAERLGVATEGLFLMCESRLEDVEAEIAALQPALVVLDSIQTVYSDLNDGVPGSLAQVRGVAVSLVRVAKLSDIPMVVIGHVTKSGDVAGPRALEHMVDVVLYLEGERHSNYRLLRAVKNRFGSTNELGVFEMAEMGLREVANPSLVFLEERAAAASGSVVVAGVQGTRPLLFEVQALVTVPTYANPRRLAHGIDLNRLHLLTAILDKKVGLNLSSQDVYLNVVGGIQCDEPAADLGICLAVASSLRNRPLPPRLLALGEVGLTGEVRSVTRVAERLAEAAKLGFNCCLLPQGNLRELKGDAKVALVGVTSVAEAIEKVEEWD